MTNINGGCLCGNIRYQIKQVPRTTIQCHCTNCQKQSGSAFSINLVVKMDSVEIDKTKLACYKDQGDSGGFVYRYFCPTCGSALITGNADLSATAVIKAGSLDDSSQVKPAMSIWERSRQSWVPLCEDVMHFEQAPKG